MMTGPERRSVGVIAAVAVMRMLGLFMLLPVLAISAGELDGATPLLIGLAVSGYGVTQAALQIPFGTLSDRLGRRPVIVGGLLIFGVGSIVAARADTITGLIAGRLLQGAGAVSSTLTALLADRTRASVRLRATAILGVSIGGSFLLALLLGPILSQLLSVQGLFWISASLALLAVAAILSLPGTPVPARPIAAAPGEVKLLTAGLLTLDIAVFVLHMQLTALFVMLPFTLRDHVGLASSQHWRFYVMAILGSLLIAVPMLMSGEKRREPRYLGAAFLMIAVCFAMLSLNSMSLPLVFGATVLFFAGFNFLEAGLPAWISLTAPTARRGAALGVFSSLQFLGAFCGGLLGGLLLGAPESGLGYAVLALVTAALALLIALLRRR